MFVRDLSNTADVLDARDLIERVEELRGEREAFEHDDDGNLTGDSWADAEPEDAEELASLESFLEQMKGHGGDHEWEGSWYPVTLINDSYFEEYAEEFASDIGAISREAQWPLRHIDWAAAAAELQIDYSTAEFDGVTYWYR